MTIEKTERILKLANQVVEKADELCPTIPPLHNSNIRPLWECVNALRVACRDWEDQKKQSIESKGQ